MGKPVNIKNTLKRQVWLVLPQAGHSNESVILSYSTLAIKFSLHDTPALNLNEKIFQLFAAVALSNHIDGSAADLNSANFATSQVLLS